MEIEKLAKEFQKKVNDYAASTKDDLEKASLELQETRQKIDSDLKALNLEKEKMADLHISMDGIVKLNVSGQLIQCTRNTLSQFGNSFLASMFSGRWDESQLKDSKGNIFLNFDPDSFCYILKFLRFKEMVGELTKQDEQVVTGELRNNRYLHSLWTYLGLPTFEPAIDGFYNNSKVLSSDNQRKALMEWLPTTSTTLLYRHSEHKNIDYDGAANTIVLFRSSAGHIFGGYNPQTWDHRKEKITASTANSFIFTLSNPYNDPPTRFHIKKGHNPPGIYAHANGPSFGGGHDLCLSYSNFPYSYIDTIGHGRNTFTGARNHVISDYEIWNIN
eukprot:Awhi_evm1s9593